MRELIVTNRFKRDFRTLPTHIREAVHEAIEKIRLDPQDETLNIKKLVGHTDPSLYRVRTGVYRVVFAYTRTTLTLYRACHRRDVYKRL